ncbi:MAG: M48 family metallopeptidase [Maricaulaceae bacterium]
MKSSKTYAFFKLLCSCMLLSGSSFALADEIVDRDFDKKSVEAGLWHQSDQIEQKLNMSAARIKDPNLNSYINNLNKIIAGNHAEHIRLSLLKAPVFNAGILPNGAMFVNSGLMLRVENEAQLACVLAHENAHYLNKHSLQRAEEASKSNQAHAFVSITTLGFGSIVSAFIAASEFSNFSKANEKESDIESIILMGELGYDQTQCAQVWANIIDESLASSNKKVKKRGVKSPIFGSHPSSPDREEYLLEQAKSSNAKALIANDNVAYRKIIRPHLVEWLEAELTHRDYGSMLHLIDRLEKLGGDEGVLNFARGRVYETRKSDGDKERMDAAYLVASNYDDTPAGLWRSVGDMHARANEKEKAIAAFEQYLIKAPQAPDKDLIKFMITDLRGTP